MAGGKSRKTGGISKELIERIKAGNAMNAPEKPLVKSRKPTLDPFGLAQEYKELGGQIEPSPVNAKRPPKKRPDPSKNSLF